MSHLNANIVDLESFLEVKAYSQRNKPKKVGLAKHIHHKTALLRDVTGWTRFRRLHLPSVGCNAKYVNFAGLQLASKVLTNREYMPNMVFL